MQRKVIEVFMTKVLVNGAFDILHSGHINLLKYAKYMGDYLIVALDTDERIKEAKGNDRPVNNQRIRKMIMETLKPVDELFLLLIHHLFYHKIIIYSALYRL